MSSIPLPSILIICCALRVSYTPNVLTSHPPYSYEINLKQRQ